MPFLFGPTRKSIRWPAYDYASEGLYYVTMCVQDRATLFGRVENGAMICSPAGEMVQTAWQNIAIYDPRISVDEFIVMPNHLHGIVVIGPDVAGRSECIPGRGRCPAPTFGTVARMATVLPMAIATSMKQVAKAISLSSIVRRFKSWTTNQYQKVVHDKGWPPFHKRLWQRNYYEHIVRTDTDLYRIREYIKNNPKNWDTDPEHP